MDLRNNQGYTFKLIREKYGMEFYQEFQMLIRKRKKLASLKNQRIFLLTCHRLKLQPKFLNFKVNHISFSNNKFTRKFNNKLSMFKRVILNYLISDVTLKIRELENHINNFENNIMQVFDCESRMNFGDSIDRIVEQYFLKTKTKQIKKIDNLTKKVSPVQVMEHQTNSNWVINLSSTDIPADVSEILSLGPNFAFNYNNYREIPINNIISNVEASIDHLSQVEKINIRSKITNVVTNFKNHLNSSASSQKNTFDNNIKVTRDFIKNNPEIICLKPDKSNKTVVMNKTDYEHKMLEMLNDPNVYAPINHDPTNKFQKLNNDLIKTWESKKYIPSELTKQLKINNSLSPKIYGLPKLHKPNIPLRPIVSCVQSPLYNLSKFLASSVSNIVGKTEFSIRNSFEFKKFVDEVSIGPDDMLISLDVISLYTNIPVDLAIQSIKKHWNELKEFTPLPLEEFVKAIEITLSTTYFQFNNKYYKQIFGCAMGAPISSVIAELVMEDLENHIISKLHFKPVFFKRYVDDCICCLPKSEVPTILNFFNEYHPKLQFTIEKEENFTINFLDMTLIRRQNQILTKYYQKPTASGRYVNFNSSQPMTHKKNVVIALADRAIHLTNGEFRSDTINNIKENLLKNNYPPSFINSIFKNRLHRFYNSSKFQTNKNKETIKYVPLPYVSGLSEKLNRVLSPYNLSIANKNYHNFNFISSRIKDSIPYYKQTHVVYKVPCQDCDQVYIGQTMQHLNERLNGHKYAKNITALKKHATANKHVFDFAKTKIIGKESNHKARGVLELIHIKKHTNAVNDRTEIASLFSNYASIL